MVDLIEIERIQNGNLIEKKSLDDDKRLWLAEKAPIKLGRVGLASAPFESENENAIS